MNNFIYNLAYSCRLLHSLPACGLNTLITTEQRRNPSSELLPFLQPQPMDLGAWENAFPSLIGPGCDQAAERNNSSPISSQGNVGRFNPLNLSQTPPPPDLILCLPHEALPGPSSCSYTISFTQEFSYYISVLWGGGAVNKANPSNACICKLPSTPCHCSPSWFCLFLHHVLVTELFS